MKLVRSARQFVLSKILKLFLRVYVVHGDEKRVIVGKNVSLMNTIINTASGEVCVGDYTIFGHGCMLLTGRHEFLNGKRKKLSGFVSEVPTVGSDITIGTGCWVASGVIIIGPCEIGDNCIIGAGSVVTGNIPDGSILHGPKAKIIAFNKG